jgi:hypothetical protein
MTIHSYVVEHDVGFAPNPFYGVCTLAACKPRIRERAKLGDIVLGFGSAKHGYAGLLVYWMRINAITDFDQYWFSEEFSEKRPTMNGSFMKVYGDNIYHRDDKTGEFFQEYSFHSTENGEVDIRNRNRDTGRTSRVLLAKDFLYLGRNAVKLPDELVRLEKRGRGEKKCSDPNLVGEFEQWIATIPERGYYGRPIDWPPVVKKQR